MAYEMRGEASLYIDAPPDRLYDLVSDITRMGEWSPECVGAEWDEGSTSAVAGARFSGRNRNGDNEWVTPNTILVAEPGREFTWVVGTADFQVCRWSFRFQPANGGTDVTESFELGTVEVGFTSAVLEAPEDERQGMVDARREVLVNGMQHTLERLKASAERD
jgi:uncharacterized protein YndB with AHSA1/START domain